MEDLLIWSKSQMQHFHPEYRKVVLREVIDKEIGVLYDQLGEKEARIADEVPDTMVRESDENFLSVIIRNLLQNVRAVRYIVRGTGWLSLRVTLRSLPLRMRRLRGVRWC